jgi:hypothetical protein
LRELADAERIARVARELGRVVPAGTRMYLTGGATAVLEGWRASTVDVDVRFEPDSEAALPEWRERSRFRLREGNLEVFDFDPYSQALSKLQRGFELDLADVDAMVKAGQVNPVTLLRLYTEIEDELFRFPAVDPPALRDAVESLGNSA